MQIFSKWDPVVGLVEWDVNGEPIHTVEVSNPLTPSASVDRWHVEPDLTAPDWWADTFWKGTKSTATACTKERWTRSPNAVEFGNASEFVYVSGTTDRIRYVKYFLADGSSYNAEVRRLNNTDADLTGYRVTFWHNPADRNKRGYIVLPAKEFLPDPEADNPQLDVHMRVTRYITYILVNLAYEAGE